ncbi:MAG: TRAP transporter large permease, partial [Planctomycetes bacterium]|nr:TRAP transporter large permease [Planctomycetota bacterium]
MDALAGIIALIIMICIGVSIPFAFGAVVMYYYFTFGGSPATTIAVGYSNINSLVVLEIPLFIISGGVIERVLIGDA